MKVIASVVSMFMLAVTLGAAAPPASANQVCTGYKFRSLGGNTTAGFIGQQVTTTIRFATDDTCVTSVEFRFIGPGGTGIQTLNVAPQYEGGVVAAVVNWTPATANYQLQATVYYYNMGLGWGYGSIAGPTFYYNIGPFSEAPRPSGQSAASLVAVDRSITLTWLPPSVNPSSVHRYRVINALNGLQVCETEAGNRGCVLSELADGPYAYWVRAVNVLGAGETSISTSIVNVGPPASPTITKVQAQAENVTLTWTTSTSTTAVPRTYRVVNSAGVEVCGVGASQADITRGTMSCTPKVPFGQLTQFTVTVETSLGNATSAPSPVVTTSDPARSRSCLAAKANLKKATKSGKKKTIASARKRVNTACSNQTINYL